MQINRFHWIGIRLLICFVAAFDININGHWYLLEKAFKSPMFYLAFAISFGICYLLLFIIHQNNIRLNAKYPWSESWLIRFLRQITDGILLPAAVDLILIVLYYLLTGQGNKIDEHLYYEYRRVVHFIVAINLVYIVVFYLLAILSKRELDQHILTIKHNGVDIKLNATTDILYVYKIGRNIKVHTVSGNNYSKKDTISAFKQQYQNIGFLQVNPSAIINLAMLNGSAKGSRSKTLHPLFKPQFQDKVSPGDFEKLRVTREYLSNFKKEMKKYMASDVQI